MLYIVQTSLPAHIIVQYLQPSTAYNVRIPMAMGKLLDRDFKDQQSCNLEKAFKTIFRAN